MRLTGRKSLRLVGWVAAYALALHTILISFALPAVHAGTSGDLTILCLGGDSAGDKSAPHTIHCPDCIGAVSIAPPPAPAVVHIQRVAHAHTAHAHVARRQHAETVHRPGQPRAPPFV